MSQLKTSPTILASLWATLNEPPGTPNPAKVAKHAALIAATGWADTCRFEDLLHDLGLPGWPWPDFHDLLEIPRQTLFERPRVRDQQCVGVRYTAAADVATMLIMLERIGFAIDPTPMVEAVQPVLAGKQLVTGSEVRVLWYRQERHRCEPVTISTGERPGFWPTDEVKLSTGYRVELWRLNNRLQMITVTAPRYRKMRVAA